MKRLLLMFLLTVSLSAGAAEINWETNYQSALQKAKSSSTPILLFFTGSDWCTWCNKLEDEVLETPEFMNAVSDKLIFVKLDFPMKEKQDPAIDLQNKKLREKHAVRGFPTLIIIDPNENTIGVTGYRPGGGKQYADHVLKIVNDYQAYNHSMGRLEKEHYTGKELKRLYQKATELGFTLDAEQIIKVGMESDLSHFFLTERYRQLVDMGLLHDQNTVELKKQILASDPKNDNLLHYQIAVIEFEDYCERIDYEKISPDACVAPLVNYMDQFGKRDDENLWRLNMVVAQVYLDKKNLEKALKFAEASYDAAPEGAQTEISMVIRNIQTQMQ